MLQVVATGTPNNHSMRSDIKGLKHFRHDSDRYVDETIRSRRICFGEDVLDGMRMAVLLPMKSQLSIPCAFSMIPGKFVLSVTSAVGAEKIQVEKQRIKRSRNICVTRPIEARGSKSVSQVKSKEEKSWTR